MQKMKYGKGNSANRKQGGKTQINSKSKKGMRNKQGKKWQPENPVLL